MQRRGMDVTQISTPTTSKSVTSISAPRVPRRSPPAWRAPRAAAPSSCASVARPARWSGRAASRPPAAHRPGPPSPACVGGDRRQGCLPQIHRQRLQLQLLVSPGGDEHGRNRQRRRGTGAGRAWQSHWRHHLGDGRGGDRGHRDFRRNGGDGGSPETCNCRTTRTGRGTGAAGWRPSLCCFSRMRGGAGGLAE